MTIKLHTLEELEALSKSELIAYIRQLEVYVTRDSTNSSKPPSRDGAEGRDKRKKKTTSLRKPGERKQGGQTGHAGATLQPREEPDVKVPLLLKVCPLCEKDLSEKDQTGSEIKRQVFDLPKPSPLICTEYSALEYQCRSCECLVHSEFPPGVNAPVQYGSRLLAWLVYMKDQLLLPYSRIEVFFRDLLEAPISAATIEKACKMADQNLEEWEKRLIVKLLNEAVLGADESGLRVNQELHWLHVVSSESLTHYAVHEKRGKEAMDAIGILPEYTGCLVHDFLGAYLKYGQCDHGLCNQHHFRDLEAVGEMEGQSWAPEMKELLQTMLRWKHEHEANGTKPTQEQTIEWTTRYLAILKTAEKENPLPPDPPPSPDGKRRPGRKKKGKARNLFERFRDWGEAIVAFFEDFRIPFTNNQAEQDIRMIKVQQKVSGCFRTRRGANRFARIRSYLSTMRKQGHNLFEALRGAIEGNPVSELHEAAPSSKALGKPE